MRCWPEALAVVNHRRIAAATAYGVAAQVRAGWAGFVVHGSLRGDMYCIVISRNSMSISLRAFSSRSILTSSAAFVSRCLPPRAARAFANTSANLLHLHSVRLVASGFDAARVLVAQRLTGSASVASVKLGMTAVVREL